VALDRQGLWP